MDDNKLAPYLWSWLALLGLLVLNVAVALLDPELGAWANLSIAAIQVLLVLAVFMYLRGASPLLRLFAMAGFFWLLVLFGLAQSDFATRFEDRAIGRLVPFASASGEAAETGRPTQ